MQVCKAGCGEKVALSFAIKENKKKNQGIFKGHNMLYYDKIRG